MLNKINEVGANKQTLFDLLGGDGGTDSGGVATIRNLVETFYDVMEADPKAAQVRALHPQDLTQAREKLFMFLVGWTGGPQLYINAYGHPRLRARHMPFAIDEAARDQWMYCMTTAMQQCQLNGFVMAKMAEQLHGVADFMRNQ